MFDGIKILDLSVSTDDLLQNDLLTFPLPIDERTGSILNRPRRDTNQGLTFTLIPRQVGGMRCELQGSLHKYRNNGIHNADDFTAVDLLTTLDDLVTTYRIDPFLSRLNNVEFGVNIHLPFPVAYVLDRLIAYQGVPFVKDNQNGGIYYQATLKQYGLKLYDKGKQYGLSGNVLRVEVKVFRMQYLTNKRIYLDTVADLLNVQNYAWLGKLLLDVFTNVLFDEPTIKAERLTPRQRNLLLEGRNARYWQLAACETFTDTKEYNRKRKHLQRQEKRFRTLINEYRQGVDYQAETAELIKKKWNQLTTVSPDLLTAIQHRLVVWKDEDTRLPKCPKITGFIDLGTLTQQAARCPKITDLENGKVSQNYPLSLGKYWDTDTPPSASPYQVRVAPSKPGRKCLVTGVDISNQKPGSRFISVATVRALYNLNRNQFDQLANQFLTEKQRTTGDLNQWANSISHNVRNVDSNQRNRLQRIGSTRLIC